MVSNCCYISIKMQNSSEITLRRNWILSSNSFESYSGRGNCIWDVLIIYLEKKNQQTNKTHSIASRFYVKSFCLIVQICIDRWNVFQRSIIILVYSIIDQRILRSSNEWSTHFHCAIGQMFFFFFISSRLYELCKMMLRAWFYCQLNCYVEYQNGRSIKKKLFVPMNIYVL